MKNFQEIFDSYFHGKYTFEKFLTTIPCIDISIVSKQFNNNQFYSYKKNNGKLTKEAKELKDYHKFIENIVIEYMQESDSVYSYSKEKSIFDCINLHKNSKIYFKTDIKNFFQSIILELIRKMIIENIPNIQITDIGKYIESILKLVTYSDVLPVGFTTSPKLSNKILFEFDIKIKEYCNQSNIIYSRYSDDLIFSSNYYTNLKDLKNIIEQILKSNYDNRFSLNDKKTKLLNKSKRILLLGMIITPNGHITVEKSLKKKIKQLLYLYKSNKEKYERFLNENFSGSEAKAYGKLNYIYEIDKDYIVYLRKKYGNYIIDEFLHGAK